MRVDTEPVDNDSVNRIGQFTHVLTESSGELGRIFALLGRLGFGVCFTGLFGDDLADLLLQPVDLLLVRPDR